MGDFAPWYAGALGIAVSALLHLVLTGRALGGTGAWAKVVHWRSQLRDEREEAAMAADMEALQQEMLAATQAQFGDALVQARAAGAVEGQAQQRVNAGAADARVQFSEAVQQRMNAGAADVRTPFGDAMQAHLPAAGAAEATPQPTLRVVPNPAVETQITKAPATSAPMQQPRLAAPASTTPATSAPMQQPRLAAPASTTPATSAPMQQPRLTVAASANFLAMVFVGGALAAALRGHWHLHTDLGPAFTALWGDGLLGWGVLMAGGAAVGFGTRLSGGCTSGHGLMGTARLQIPSLVATATFLSTAVAVSLLLDKVLR